MVGKVEDFIRRVEEQVSVLDDVRAELARAKAKFPDQHLPDGTEADVFAKVAAENVRALCQRYAEEGRVTWWHILREEVCEVNAESEWWKLRAELLQVAAVAIRWVEDGDARDDAERTAKEGE